MKLYEEKLNLQRALRSMIEKGATDGMKRPLEEALQKVLEDEIDVVKKIREMNQDDEGN